MTDVPRPVPAPPLDAGGRTVVIGASGSVASLRAARRVAVLYRRTAAYLVVAVDHETDVSRASTTIDDTLGLLDAPARRMVAFGDPASVLSRVAADHDAVVIAIGVTPGSGSHPVASRLLRRAPCPVLLLAAESAENAENAESTRRSARSVL